MLNRDGKESKLFLTGETVRIQIDYEVYETVEDAVFGIGIFRIDGLQCYGTNTRIDRLEQFDLCQAGTAIVELNELNFIAGKYLLDVAIESGEGIPVDYFREVCEFEMHSLIGDVGVARMKHEWEV